MSEATSGTSVPEGPSGVAGLFGATPELQGGWETTQPTLVLPCLDGSSQLLAGADKVLDHLPRLSRGERELFVQVWRVGCEPSAPFRDGKRHPRVGQADGH